MSQLRQNLISREWVIIDTSSGMEPKDFAKLVLPRQVLAEHKKDCPCCPGNEDSGLRETFRVGGGKGWKIRVVYPTKPVLADNCQKERQIQGIYRSMSGFGSHEIVIENIKHNAESSSMAEEEVCDVVHSYKSRYLSLVRDKRVEAITIFKNHAAVEYGIEHAHSQIIATPIIPPQVRRRMEQAVDYFEDTGRCIFCQTLEEELKAKDRIILQTSSFLVFLPYAALSPFHIWIFPKRHSASFGEINETEIRDLSKVLKKTLFKIKTGLNDPDFSFSLRSIPANVENPDYFHWYISLVPRFNFPGGFELGSGMFINHILPEISAEYLRDVE